MSAFRAVLGVLAVVATASCASGGMVETRYDGRTGRSETVNYTNHYAAGDWLADGRIGIDVWIDHEKTVVPVVHTVQQATGTLGPSDLEATGAITAYFVNLDRSPHRLGRLAARSSPGGERAQAHGLEVVLPARSVSRVVVGRIPILNYAREVTLALDYELDGQPQVKRLTVKRLTENEYARHSGRSGLPPYPWFLAPHFPFDPPLQKNWKD